MPVDEAALDAMLAAGPDNGLEKVEESTFTQEPAAPATEPETSSDELPEGDKFDRAYVEKLRKEAASYRDRAKKYNETFEGYEDDAVQEWLELAQALKSDPRAAGMRFKEIYEAIEAQYTEGEGETPDLPDLGTEDAPLTRAQFDKLMAERERELDLKGRVARIELDAKELGYEKGSEDYDELLWRASRTKTGSVKEAHEAIQKRYQDYFDKQVKEVGDRPNPMITDGAPASGEKKITSWEDADKALAAWLDGQG